MATGQVQGDGEEAGANHTLPAFRPSQRNWRTRRRGGAESLCRRRSRKKSANLAPVASPEMEGGCAASTESSAPPRESRSRPLSVFCDLGMRTSCPDTASPLALATRCQLTPAAFYSRRDAEAQRTRACGAAALPSMAAAGAGLANSRGFAAGTNSPRLCASARTKDAPTIEKSRGARDSGAHPLSTGPDGDSRPPAPRLIRPASASSRGWIPASLRG